MTWYLLELRPSCCPTSLFVDVRGTRPPSMPVAMLTMKKELHGFLFLCMYVVLFSYNYGALLHHKVSPQPSFLIVAIQVEKDMC